MSIFSREEPLGDYEVTIKTPMAYRLAIKHVDIGISMKQTSLAIQAAKEAVNVSNSTGMNQAKVDAFDRVQISPNYQTIANVLRLVWAFSIDLDASTCRGTSYVDIRARFCFGNARYLTFTSYPSHFLVHTPVLLSSRCSARCSTSSSSAESSS